MRTQVELSYLLKKNEEEDLFDSYLPIRFDVTRQFKDQEALNAQASRARMGIRIQLTLTGPVLHLVRLAEIQGLRFPDETQPDLEFTKVSLRLLSELTDSQGRQVEYATSYEIEVEDDDGENTGRYSVIDGDELPPHQQWLALVTREDGEFQFLHFKADPADPGSGGDPCELAGCNDPNRTIITAIACVCKGCG